MSAVAGQRERQALCALLHRLLSPSSPDPPGRARPTTSLPQRRTPNYVVATTTWLRDPLGRGQACTTRAARAASARVRVAALPCSATRRAVNEGAGRDGSARRAARVLTVNQPSPTHAVAAARPKPIQPSARLWTRVKPSQKASPMMPPMGWANSTSDRAPGTTGARREATNEGGSQRSRAARRAARWEGTALAVRTAAAVTAGAGVVTGVEVAA